MKIPTLAQFKIAALFFMVCACETPPRLFPILGVLELEAGTAGQHQLPLSKLQAEILTAPDPHDLYLEIAGIGNEGSVPVLLERFKRDYGGEKEVLASGMVQGFICTQAHLVDALRTITNTDQGMYYPRWEAWYKSNKNLSQNQWMLNGFQAYGLHPSSSLNDRFVSELIALAGERNDFYSFNAIRLLKRAEPDLRPIWIEEAAKSPDKFHRLGAVRVLASSTQGSQETLLHRLASDKDSQVRQEAQKVINERSESSPATKR